MAACWPLDIPSTQKFVLISLADNANDDGICWPSIATIAKRTALHRATVMRAIRWLIDEGFLVAESPGNGLRNRYKVIHKPVAQSDRLRSATGSTERLDRSQSATGPVAQSDTNRKEPSRTVTLARVRAREGNGSASRKKGGMTDALEFFAEAAANATH